VDQKPASKPLTRAEIIAAIVSFAGIFVAAIVAHLLILAGLPENIVQNTLKVVVILLFCVFGFSLIGLMLHVFIVLQGGIGNANVGIIKFLRENERLATYIVWGFLGLGCLIAIPAALWDSGMQSTPSLKSDGTLVADIGMTLAEVQKRSTIKLNDPFSVKTTGETYCIGEAVFDYQLGDSGMRFPKSRYYWLITTGHGDERLAALNVGVSPTKLPRLDFDNYVRSVRRKLKDAGWIPGHFVWKSAEDIQLHSGSATSGDGRYWKRGNTLIILEQKRMDDEQNGENPVTAGEFILYLDLRPLSAEPTLVFDPNLKID
jgi:hypothetical protein